VDKKKIKFLGVIIKIDNEYVIHGISKWNPMKKSFKYQFLIYY
jgi:ribonuclease HI